MSHGRSFCVLARILMNVEMTDFFLTQKSPLFDKHPHVIPTAKTKKNAGVCLKYLHFLLMLGLVPHAARMMVTSFRYSRGASSSPFTHIPAASWPALDWMALPLGCGPVPPAGTSRNLELTVQPDSGWGDANSAQSGSARQRWRPPAGYYELCSTRKERLTNDKYQISTSAKMQEWSPGLFMESGHLSLLKIPEVLQQLYTLEQFIAKVNFQL